MDTDLHTRFMTEALEEARKAYAAGEVPVGAVAVHQGQILAKSHNLMETLKDASAHAELLVLKKSAAILDRWRLDDVALYVTVEPCPMCAMALVLFRIRSLVYGALEPRTGAAGSFVDLLQNDRLNHKVAVISGVCEQEAGELLRNFFKARRGGNL